MAKTSNLPNFINAHTHIFNANDTPKYLAKKFVIWPFYYLINTQWAISILKWYRKRERKKFKYRAKNQAWQKYLSSKSPIYQFTRKGFLLVVNFLFFFYLLYLIRPIIKFWPLKNRLECIFESSFSKTLLFLPERIYYILIVVFIFLFFSKLRNWLFKLIWSAIKKRLGKEWVEFLLRYKNILLFAGYGNMTGIFNKLKNQYPPQTGFVVLPMDMEFMKAGNVQRPYMEQMTALLKVKKNNPNILFPFLFAHPERMKQVIDGKPYFKYYKNTQNQIELADCHVKDFFVAGCAGVKIYPAMGYYPFDEALLPLWLYCEQEQIPITTHCSVGPIFYRGNIKKLPIKDIDRHPVFEEIVGKDAQGKNKIEKLRLPLHKNSVFQRNFTHPLNYVCLLNDELLKRVLDFHCNTGLNELFGYDSTTGGLEKKLTNLKVNLAHYGGAENWDEFLTKDRYDEANYIINKPNVGLELKRRMKNRTNLYNFWHYVDWFSIITSMIIEFDNVYTDVSYTSHDLKYLNLLSEIMDNTNVQNRVLFGTDFYVVSNHKSEKQYWIDMQNTLGQSKWQLLTKTNPHSFLN